MMSLFWYYRPEHTQGGRNPSMHCEVSCLYQSLLRFFMRKQCKHLTCLDYEFQRGSRQHKLSALSKPWRPWLRVWRGGTPADLHCSLSAFEIGHLCSLHWLSALVDVVNIWVSKLCVCVCAVGFQNEIFASRHQDENSVACIEDKCYVLTLAQYCR